jgi:hypothetical protein
MSGNEIALTMIIVITTCAVLFTLALNRWVKVPRKKPLSELGKVRIRSFMELIGITRNSHRLSLTYGPM